MPKVFRSITRLVYYSNGGFSFSELYSEVPVYVRRFLVKEIENIKQKEKKAMEDGGGSGGGGTASAEDTGKALEELRKKSPESTGDAEEDLKKVFGTEEERNRGKPTPSRENPSQSQQQASQKAQEQPTPETSTSDNSDETPMKAEELEQVMDKLKDSI